MSSNHHTPIANGANADNTVFNAPLAQLDQVLTDMLDGSEPFTVFKGGAGAADASAAMQIDSTSQGVLVFPRMTEAQRDAISSPAEGLIVYNTDDGAPNAYDSSVWLNYLQSGDAIQPIIAKTVTGLVSSVSIGSIPQTYQDLLLRIKIRSTLTNNTFNLRFNNDAAAVYNWLRFSGATVVTTNSSASDDEVRLWLAPNTGAEWSEYDIYIRNYTDASNWKQGDFQGHSHGTELAVWGGFQWRNNSALNQIAFYPSSAGVDFDALTSYALYGIGSN